MTSNSDPITLCRSIVARDTPHPPTRSEYVRIGQEASQAAQRAYLLVKLRAHDWNLTATARSTGLANASNVTREIRKLGLIAEYQAAKKAGKISRGPRAVPASEIVPPDAQQSGAEDSPPHAPTHPHGADAPR